MASTAQKTASTHSSAVVRGTHEFHIVGCSDRKRFASVTSSSSSIKSGSFLAGGHTWALACSFDEQGHLASITLELIATATAKDKDVVATAGIRIEDPLGEWPPAVWRSDDASRFQRPTTPSSGGSSSCWKLPVPDAYYHDIIKTCYVRDDRLTIECTVDVLQELSPAAEAAVVETRHCLVSTVPPPTISQDLHKLLLVDGDTEERRRRCMQPDVTFVVEKAKIQAHKLVLAMRSPVFAAEFRWHTTTNDNESGTRLSIDDMSAPTFRAMLRFIYTDELPIKASNSASQQRACKEKYASKRREAMARDLLVAADRYDLERLRLMCQNILLEGIHASTVMGTLLLVRGRQTCRQLEDSCIEYIAASGPEVYAAVMATEEYQELKNSCSPLIIEIMERVATHNGFRNSSSDDGIKHHRLPPKKSWSTYSAAAEVHGAHEFRIPNFCAVQRSLGVGQSIHSGTFRVGDHDWVLRVHPSEKEGDISVYLLLLSHPPAHGVWVSKVFSVNGPSGDSFKTNRELVTIAKKGDGWGHKKFTTLQLAKSCYLDHDGSLTIHCDLLVTKQPYSTSTTSIPTTMIVVPSSNIALQLEELLVSEQGSDLMFLVEGNEICAHGIVISTRAPILYEAVAEAAAANNKDGHIVVKIDGMKATVFKAVLHFVYTDELPPLGNSTVVDQDMLAAASRFGPERMKIICENLLAEHISKENAIDTLKVARRHHCSKLQDYCMDFILSVPHLAKEVIKMVSLE